MSLSIELDTDHTRFRVELPSGHHITVPADGGGAAQLHRLLLAQKRAAIAERQGQSDSRLASTILHLWHVGSETSPTQQEIDHIANHMQPQDGCPFCRDALRRAQAKGAPKAPAFSEEDLLDLLTQPGA